MTRNKKESKRMKTSLAELLVQKNIPVPLMPGDDVRFHHLAQENRELKDRMVSLRAEVEQLRQISDSRTAEPVIDTEELFQKAVTDLKSGSPVDALGLLQTILIVCPGHIRAMLNLSVVYAGLNLESRAMKTLHAVLMLDPDNTTARRNMDILMEQANS
jgi:cell division septum initiation protein DivIVA